MIHLEMPLPCTSAAPRLAREAVDSVAHALGTRRAANARLLISELASNAVMYGREPIKLDIQIEEQDACFAVRDDGDEQPRMRPEDERVGGFGLRIVDRIADEWGVEWESSNVWFVLRAGAPVQI